MKKSHLVKFAAIFVAVCAIVFSGCNCPMKSICGSGDAKALAVKAADKTAAEQPVTSGDEYIYAGLIGNKGFVAVGSPNPGTGLFRVTPDGKLVEIIGFKNMRTFALQVFPNVEKGLIYCANGNGFFVSKDNAKKWRVTTGWEITEVLHVAAVKNDPKIVYIGTAYGLYKSTEYGENFKMIDKGFVGDILICNENPDMLYLGKDNGLYVSKDAGASFEKVDMNFASPINVIAQNPKNSDIFYVGTENNGIYMSVDHGKTWTQAAAPADKATIYSITVNPVNDTIYAGTYEKGVLRSTDGGKTWQTCTKGFEIGDKDLTQILSVAVDRKNPDIVYAGTANTGVYRSTDNGLTWAKFAIDGGFVFDVKVE